MRVIVYGLGSRRITVEKYLKSNHEIIAYTDSFYEEIIFRISHAVAVINTK